MFAGVVLWHQADFTAEVHIQAVSTAPEAADSIAAAEEDFTAPAAVADSIVPEAITVTMEDVQAITIPAALMTATAAL